MSLGAGVAALMPLGFPVSSSMHGFCDHEPAGGRGQCLSVPSEDTTDYPKPREGPVL